MHYLLNTYLPCSQHPALRTHVPALQCICHAGRRTDSSDLAMRGDNNVEPPVSAHVKGWAPTGSDAYAVQVPYEPPRIGGAGSTVVPLAGGRTAGSSSGGGSTDRSSGGSYTSSYDISAIVGGPLLNPAAGSSGVTAVSQPGGPGSDWAAPAASQQQVRPSQPSASSRISRRPSLGPVVESDEEGHQDDDDDDGQRPLTASQHGAGWRGNTGMF